MCLAPYNLTEAAISARGLASQAMELLFDKKEELPEGEYLLVCDRLKKLYEKSDNLAHPERFITPFCEWSSEAQHVCRMDLQTWQSKIAWLLDHFEKDRHIADD